VWRWGFVFPKIPMKKRLRKKLRVSEFQARFVTASARPLTALEKRQGLINLEGMHFPTAPASAPRDVEMKRISSILDEFYPDSRGKDEWLQKPLAHFAGRSPAQAIADGDWSLVLLALENALAGHPD
jgi:hypothetical protein